MSVRGVRDTIPAFSLIGRLTGAGAAIAIPLKSLIAAMIANMPPGQLLPGGSVNSVQVNAGNGMFGGVLLADKQILVGQTSGAPSAKTVSGDGTLADTGALTVTKSNGVAFGTAAFAASSSFDTAGAAAAAQAAAEAASDPVGSAATVAALRASATVFGLAKVDGTTLNASGGVLSVVAQTLPTRQVLTSGTAATYTTPAGVVQLRIRMWGGGAGGGASATTGGSSAGGNGGDTIFNSVNAGGGKADAGAGFGAGGSSATGTASFRLKGAPGGQYGSLIVTATTAEAQGGNGGGNGGGGGGSGGAAGTAGAANTGGGGGSGGIALGAFSSLTEIWGGGGAGEYVELIITSPAATYAYTIGAGGSGATAGAGGQNGAAGGSGLIIVDEFYGV